MDYNEMMDILPVREFTLALNAGFVGFDLEPEDHIINDVKALEVEQLKHIRSQLIFWTAIVNSAIEEKEGRG